MREPDCITRVKISAHVQMLVGDSRSEIDLSKRAASSLQPTVFHSPVVANRPRNPNLVFSRGAGCAPGCAVFSRDAKTGVNRLSVLFACSTDYSIQTARQKGSHRARRLLCAGRVHRLHVVQILDALDENKYSIFINKRLCQSGIDSSTNLGLNFKVVAAATVQYLCYNYGAMTEPALMVETEVMEAMWS